MENNEKSYRWYVYKSLYTGRWKVWNSSWRPVVDPLMFDTWQEAMDCVTRRIELSFDPLIERWS